MSGLRRALAILGEVSQSDVPPSIAELALRIGIPRPTAHRVVQTLIAEGYLTQDSQSNRISVGFSVLPLSASLLDHNRLRLAALPHLESLAKLTADRTNLGILHHNQVLYLAGVEKPSLPAIYTRFGKSAPAHCCSLGKAILAHLPEAEVQALLAAQPLRSFTPRSITSVLRFMEELEATRCRGYATDCEEHMPDSCCIATAIFDGQNRVMGAIGISGRVLEPLLDHVTELQRTAAVISHVI